MNPCESPEYRPDSYYLLRVTSHSGFASVAAAAAASLLSNSFGGMAGLDHSLLFPPQGLPPSFYVDAPLPPTSTAYSEFSIGDGGFRLTPPTPLPYTPVVDGPSAAKCSWSPVLRCVCGLSHIIQ